MANPASSEDVEMADDSVELFTGEVLAMHEIVEPMLTDPNVVPANATDEDDNNEREEVESQNGEVEDDAQENYDAMAGYNNMVQIIRNNQEELSQKDAIIAEKNRLLNNGELAFAQKHRELLMSREEVARLDKEIDAKNDELLVLQRTVIDTESALKIERNLQANHNITEHTTALQEEIDRLRKQGEDASEARTALEEMTKARDQAFQRLGHVGLKHDMEIGELKEQLDRMARDHSLKVAELENEKVQLFTERDATEAKLIKASSWVEDLNKKYGEIAVERDLLAKAREELTLERDSLHRTIETLNAGNESLKKLLEHHEAEPPSHIFDIAPKVADEEVICIWHGLYSEVVVLSHMMTRKPELTDLDPQQIECLKAIMPVDSAVSWNKYLEDDQHRQFLVEAFIWEQVLRHLEFNQVWLGQAGVQMKAALETMRTGLNGSRDSNDLKRYCAWRAQGAHKIREFGARDDMNAFLIASHDMMRMLRPFFPQEIWSGENNVAFGEVLNAIADILSVCQKLDKIFMTGLVHWKPKLNRHIVSWHDKLHNLPDWMGDVKIVPGGRFPMAFQVAPYLQKAGTVDGEQYNIVEIMVKGTIMPFVDI